MLNEPIVDANRRAPYGVVTRSAGAVLCGVIAGLLLPNSMQVGARFAVGGPDEPQNWGVFWGEHWAVRVVASIVATAGAGLLAGSVARRKGGLVAALAAAPSVLLWAFVTVGGWSGHLPFLSDRFEMDLSIGNKLAATLILLVTVPIAIYGGNEGQVWGRELGPHFDDRRASLLGVKWYHYLWIPLVLHLVFAQSSWAALYGFEWLKRVWKAGMSMTSFLPTIFVVGVWLTLALTWTGLWRAYRALAGIDEYPSRGEHALAVLKYGIGYPLGAAAIQAAIVLIHAGLVRLFT